jgi:hypothetical protein
LTRHAISSSHPGVKALPRLLSIAAGIVAGIGMVACSPAPPPSPAPASSTTKTGPKWAFVEVGFQITGEGKIKEVKVLASDAPPAAQKQVVDFVSKNYIPRPKIYNRHARQTILFHRPTGKFRSLRLEVHSSQPREDG